MSRIVQVIPCTQMIQPTPVSNVRTHVQLVQLAVPIHHRFYARVVTLDTCILAMGLALMSAQQALSLTSSTI